LILVGLFLVALSAIALLRGLVVEGGTVGIGDLKFNLSGTIVTLILGVACLWGAGARIDNGGSPETKTDPPVASPGNLDNDPEEESGFAILTPSDNEKVSGSKGALFEGTAPSMGSDSLRIMTIALSTQDKRVFYVSSDPIFPEGGHWSYQVGQIGAGITDIGSRFTFVVLEASEACSKELDAKNPDKAGDVYFESLPHGCRELGRRTLMKTSA
jgi:hypothetical protein